MTDGRFSPAGLTKRCHDVVLAVVSGLLRVPLGCPEMPVGAGELIERFQPDTGWVRLRQLKALRTACFGVFGLIAVAVTLHLIVPSGLVAFDGHAPSAMWSAIRTLDLYLGGLVLGVILVVTAVKLVTVRLQYDCTWYAMTAGAMRIRHGIWLIQETTITYANIQNVTVRQGPLERLFGISTIEVETAGGGGAGSSQSGAQPIGHVGRLEGVVEPERLRQRIMERVRTSRSTGLGDEIPESFDPTRGADGSAPDEVDMCRMAELLVEIRTQIRSESA